MVIFYTHVPGIGLLSDVSVSEQDIYIVKSRELHLSSIIQYQFSASKSCLYNTKIFSCHKVMPRTAVCFSCHRSC